MLKYFLNRDGVPTRRIAGQPGQGHLEIARDELAAEPLNPETDLYQAMFSRGFVRVVETDSEIMVDSPRPLNRMHRRFLEDKVIREGKKLIVNGREVLESRDKVSKAGQLVAKLIQ